MEVLTLGINLLNVSLPTTIGNDDHIISNIRSANSEESNRRIKQKNCSPVEIGERTFDQIPLHCYTSWPHPQLLS